MTRRPKPVDIEVLESWCRMPGPPYPGAAESLIRDCLAEIKWLRSKIKVASKHRGKRKGTR